MGSFGNNTFPRMRTGTNDFKTLLLNSGVIEQSNPVHEVESLGTT